MKQIATGAKTDDGEFGLQIAPMLDVMFVLLLFFMVSAGAVMKETELGIEVPGTPHPRIVISPIPVKIDISKDNLVLWNGASLGTAN